MMNGVDLQVRCLVFSCMEGSPIRLSLSLLYVVFVWTMLYLKFFLFFFRAPGAQREYESRAAVNTVVLHPNQVSLQSCFIGLLICFYINLMLELYFQNSFSVLL